MAKIIPYQFYTTLNNENKRIWVLLHILEAQDIVFRRKTISFKASHTVLLTESMKNKLS